MFAFTALRIAVGVVLSLSLRLAAADEDWWYDVGLYAPYPTQSYHSFDLPSPRLNIKQWDDRCDDGYYTLLSPRGFSVWHPGPVMLDARGNLVWMEDRFGQAMDFKVQRYNGSDYLTFWTGEDTGTFGSGVYYMLDSSYEVFQEITPVGEFADREVQGDLHEFSITDEGTALITIYEPVEEDLTEFGLDEPGWIYDSLFQEFDIATGELLFQWRSSEHYDVAETMQPIGKEGRTDSKAFDYFHINSIDKDADGNYYISSRYMHTVTCIGPSGEVRWVLGGKRNSFTDLSEGAATNFSWQHHARWHGDGRISVFDNGATKYQHTATHSRALLIQLDLEHMTAELVASYVSPEWLTAESQGSMQLLPGDDRDAGTVMVGWGYLAAYTQFAADSGEVLCNVHFGSSRFFGWGWVKSYRDFKARWVGRPTTPPSVKMTGKGTAYVSWNGATEVTHWLLLDAASVEYGEGEFAVVAQAPKDGFETRLDIASDAKRYIKVGAADAAGNILGYTAVIDRNTGLAVGAQTAWWQLSDYSMASMRLVVLAWGFAFSLLGAWKFRRPILGRMRVFVKRRPWAKI